MQNLLNVPFSLLYLNIYVCLLITKRNINNESKMFILYEVIF